jgi:hypothetical protein
MICVIDDAKLTAARIRMIMPQKTIIITKCLQLRLLSTRFLSGNVLSIAARHELSGDLIQR